MSLFPRYIPAKPAKAAKAEPTLASLATLAATQTAEVKSLHPWHHDFCQAHSDLNNCCPQSVDNNCLLSRVHDAEGNIEQLRGLSIGQGIKADDVFQLWVESGEPIEDLLEKPLWFICVAEYLAKRKAMNLKPTTQKFTAEFSATRIHKLNRRQACSE